MTGKEFCCSKAAFVIVAIIAVMALVSSVLLWQQLGIEKQKLNAEIIKEQGTINCILGALPRSDELKYFTDLESLKQKLANIKKVCPEIPFES